MRITRASVGKLVRFLGCNRAEGIEQFGTVTEVKNGFATLSVPYFLTRSTIGDGTRAEFTPTREPWRMLLPVSDSRIVGIDD